MQRKVSLIGPSTLMVSLPSKWAKKYGVKKGDALELDENGSELSIRTSKATTSEDLVLKINEPSLIRRYLNSAYIEGRDKIRIISDNNIDINQIMRELELLTGFEVVEHSEKSCVIHNVAETIEDKFDSMFRRLFLINISIGKDSSDALLKNQLNRLKDIASLKRTSNKIAFLCSRILNKRGYKDFKKVNLLFTIINNLELIADTYRVLFNEIIKIKNLKINKKVLEIYTALPDLLEMLYYSINNFNEKRMVMIKERRRILYDNLLEFVKTESSIISTHLLFILRLITDIELSFVYLYGL